MIGLNHSVQGMTQKILQDMFPWVNRLGFHNKKAWANQANFLDDVKLGQFEIYF
jgi:hypothetical protein